MIGRHAHLPSDLPSDVESEHVPARERLTLVVSDPVDDVHRTFADDVEEQRSGPFWRRQRRLLPAGLVHAAELQGDLSLCGRPLDSLHAFGRSRHPFERFDTSRRCPACHAAAGRHRA